MEASIVAIPVERCRTLSASGAEANAADWARLRKRAAPNTFLLEGPPGARPSSSRSTQSADFPRPPYLSFPIFPLLLREASLCHGVHFLRIFISCSFLIFRYNPYLALLFPSGPFRALMILLRSHLPCSGTKKKRKKLKKKKERKGMRMAFHCSWFYFSLSFLRSLLALTKNSCRNPSAPWHFFFSLPSSVALLFSYLFGHVPQIIRLFRRVEEARLLKGTIFWCAFFCYLDCFVPLLWKHCLV